MTDQEMKEWEKQFASPTSNQQPKPKELSFNWIRVFGLWVLALGVLSNFGQITVGVAVAVFFATVIALGK